jgi:hypothetical protein
MEIELKRHQWSALRSFSDSSEIPDALRALYAAHDEGSARQAYWRIDSVTISDGCLTQSTPAVSSVIVQSLPFLSESSLIYALELLSQISGGYVHEPSEQGLGPVALEDCIKEISLAFPFYCELVERSTNDQIRSACVDLIAACGSVDEGLIDRSRFVLRKALDLPATEHLRKLIVNSLRELG